jgi:tetratricopeptide (TPR) repeat protein
VCYLNLKNYEHSLSDLESAVLLNPYFSIAYYNRSLCFFSLKNYVSSLSELDKAIEFCKSLEDKKKYLYLANEMATTAKEYNKARNYIEKLFEIFDSKELLHKNIYLQSIDNAKEIDRKNQELKEKEVEMEDMMSMFAHKFRSPLDAIIYNTIHDNNPKLYTESANTMRGLLDIFSIISADDKILTVKIKNDNKGNATLMSVLNKNLNMTLLHLLSVSGMSKIHQHYMNYAKVQGKITDAVSYKEWCYDYFEMERTLQKQWEQEFSELLNQSASLAERLQWLEQYFFKLDIIGFEINTIQFKEYETTESFLFILMNEILVNAFKYYASENKQPVILEWTATEDYQILSCRNPSIRRERDQHKGSGKGHTFLSALARKTGCKFTKPKPQDDFLLEFAIPNQLLLSNSGTEK